MVRRAREPALSLSKGRARHIHIDCWSFAGEELYVAGFFGAGLAREDGGEWRLALAEAVEGGDDIVEGFEAVHALGTAAEFAGSLRAAE